MNRAIPLFCLLVLSACATGEVTVQPAGEGEFVVTYQVQPVDNINRMRQELMLKAQEACRGAYTRIEEFPDPYSFFTTLDKLNWRVRCLK